MVDLLGPGSTSASDNCARAGAASFGSFRVERTLMRNCANRCEIDFPMASSSVRMMVCL